MKASHLLGSTALALVMCSAMASAQMQQKGGEEKASPPAQGQGAGAASKGQSEKGAQQGEPKGRAAQSESGQKGSEKGTGAERSQPKEQGTKGSAQTQPSEQRTKGSTKTEPSDQGTKGAQTQPRDNRKGSAQTEPKEQGTKGSAQTQPRDSRKGSAQTEPKEQGTKGSARTQPTAQTAKGGSREGSAGRVQLSEQQRTNLHETILKERNVNRVNQVNFSINVGTRVPRSVRLALLPASVLSLVPQYRSYRYFVANDEICIIDPNTYEIVDVVSAGTQTARGQEPGRMARLMLTEEEKRIILENVDMRGDSTLALGSLSEGSPAPRGVRMETFTDAVVQQVPKIRGYKYFTAEDRVAIVDPQGTRVQLVIDAKR
jgi:Protein of unknown function (DUF1236)